MPRFRVTVLACCLGAPLAACRPADQSAAAAAAVLAADSAWAETFVNKDVTAYLTFVEPNATLQAPNGPTLTGHAAIGAMVEGFLSLPDLTGTWHPTAARAAASGDWAYSTGTYEMSFTDPMGNRVTDRGKYLVVWRRQPDGSWKMAVESFNSDTPAAGG